MAAKPNIPVSRKEMYLDVATGGSTELPSPVTREEKYLAKIAGESVGIPTPVTRYEMLLAAVAGESYTLTPVTRLEVYLAKAAGQDVEVPQPITREEMYWFDYVNGQPTPSEQEYTGAVPVTFIADGTPLLDYLISGNEEHSGTPTPDNPVMPQGTGERTGNLVRFYKEEMQGMFYGVDVTVKNAEITLNGTVTIGSGHWVEIGYKFDGGTAPTDNVVIPCEPETPYTIATEILDGDSTQVRIIAFSTSNETRIVNIGSSSTTTFSGDINRIFISLGAEGVVFNNLKFRVMLNKGSEALPYEPYGIKIPISSANTTTPVYLGEVESTRRIKKLVLDGTENWRKSLNGAMYLSPFTDESYKKEVAITSMNSHFSVQINTTSGTNAVGDNSSCFLAASGSAEYYIGARSYATAADFKAYLAAQYAAGTPVCVWYVLATEETAVVNEPLMKIGDYSDTLSMEQAGVEIPTVSGSNTLDVLTTVKPSEVYIKYKGKPVAGSQTSSQSSAYAPAEVSSQSENVDDINNSLLGKEEETE